MSMEEWPDDRLDDLFRKSAEDTDVPYEPTDWTDMARRLDQHDRQRWFDYLRRWSGIGALLLLLLGGIGWFIYDSASKSAPGRTVQTAPASRELASDKPSATTPRRPEASPSLSAGKMTAEPVTSPMAAVPVGPTGDELAKQPADEDPVSPRTTYASQPVENGPVRSSVQEAIRAEKSVQLAREATRYVGGKVSRPTAASLLPSFGEYVDNQLIVGDRSMRSSGTNTPVNAPDATPNGLVSVLSDNAERNRRPADVDPRWLPAVASLNSLSALVEQAPSAASPVVGAVSVPQAARRTGEPFPRLSILLFGAPDLSSIGLKNFERPGGSAGLSVQYQLTRRVSLYTGFMLSNKRYYAAQGEYTLPESVGYVHVKPVGIDGMCGMIDLPLNIRYDWLLRPMTDDRPPARWFASAGVTSYIIRREAYTYKYTNPNDPGITLTDWDTQRTGIKSGSFGFSNVNVSLGYERPITRRLSWQVEPFLKIPLKEVGILRIKLISTGVFLGLRYQFR